MPSPQTTGGGPELAGSDEDDSTLDENSTALEDTPSKDDDEDPGCEDGATADDATTREDAGICEDAEDAVTAEDDVTLPPEEDVLLPPSEAHPTRPRTSITRMRIRPCWHGGCAWWSLLCRALYPNVVESSRSAEARREEAQRIVDGLNNVAVKLKNQPKSKSTSTSTKTDKNKPPSSPNSSAQDLIQKNQK